MEADSKWLAQNEFHWHKNRFDSLNSAKSSDVSCSEHDSTATSVYEDADCGGKSEEPTFGQSLNKSDQHLYSESIDSTIDTMNSDCFFSFLGVPHQQSIHLKRMSYCDESYNSFKSTSSLMASNNANEHTPSTSSIDSANDCGLSVSLKKFFKHNKLTDSKMRQEMMQQVNYSSADIDRTDDTVYQGTINVINTVRHLLRGVQEANTNDYVDLVKVE